MFVWFYFFCFDNRLCICENMDVGKNLSLVFVVWGTFDRVFVCLSVANSSHWLKQRFFSCNKKYWVVGKNKCSAELASMSGVRERSEGRPCCEHLNRMWPRYAVIWNQRKAIMRALACELSAIGENRKKLDGPFMPALSGLFSWILTMGIVDWQQAWVFVWDKSLTKWTC